MHELHNILFQPEYIFLRQAFLVSALASLSFGVIGTFVVARRIGYLAGAISHCAFGGIGIGIFLQQAAATAGMLALAKLLDPIAVAVIFSVASALLIGVIQSRTKEREDSIIGAIWAIGMAIGVLFLDQTTGYHSISSYLFGDILLISTNGARLVGLLGIIVLVTTAVYFKRLEAVCFDEEYMRLRGLNTHFYLQLLLVLVAMTVVLMIQLVGIILVIALLTLPAATAARISSRLFPMVCWATLFCFLFSWCGLLISVRLNLAAGPTIIIVAGAGYITALFAQAIMRK